MFSKVNPQPADTTPKNTKFPNPRLQQAPGPPNNDDPSTQTYNNNQLDQSNILNVPAVSRMTPVTNAGMVADAGTMP